MANKSIMKRLDDVEAAAQSILRLVGELREAVAAEPSDRQVVKKLLTAFDELRAKRYNERYVFAGAKDAAQAKRLLRSMSKEEIWRRMQVYIGSNDPFYVKVRHSFGAFVTAINSLRPPAGKYLGDPAPVVGCTHTPRCESDVEHTRRRAEDMRS